MFGWFRKKPRWRVVQLPHDSRFMVQEYGYRSWVSRLAFADQESAEAWIENEIAGPNIIKEYR